MRVKLSIFLTALFLVLFSGCESDSAESKTYDLMTYLDDGEYQKALDLMGDDCSGLNLTEDECNLNQASAYFGLAEYDVTTLGQELLIAMADEESGSTKVMLTVLEKLDNDSINLGIEKFTEILGDNKENCNGTDFSTLLEIEQQACLAINPILLLEQLNEDSEASTSTVSIENLIELQDTAQGLFSDLDSAELNEEFSKVMNNEESEILNDKVALNQCALNSYKTGTYDSTACSTDSLTTNHIGNFTDSNFSEIFILEIRDSNDNLTRQLLSWRDSADTTNGTTIVLKVAQEYITLDGSECNISESTDGCYPKPKVSIDGENETLSNTVISDLNNDEEFLTSVALIIKSSDENKNKTEEEKVEEFQSNICDSVANTTYTQCIYDSNGNVTEISEDAFLQYIAN